MRLVSSYLFGHPSLYTVDGGAAPEQGREIRVQG